MPTYKVTDPSTGRTLKLTGDSPPTEAELEEIFGSVSMPSATSTGGPGPLKVLGDLARQADPTQLIKRAAPSNVLPMLGVASVNAPDVTAAAVNALPAIGNPSKIVPALANAISRPKQIPMAIKRAAIVQNGGQPTASEVLPQITGTAAGAVIEAAAQPPLRLNASGAKGPFSAGLRRPSTAIPGAFKRAGDALADAKNAARVGDSVAEASKFRVMLQKPAGVAKLAEEAKTALEGGKDLTATQLLAYKEALGKMQAEGGVFASDYAKAAGLAREMIAKKFPDLAEKTIEMAVNFAAKGKKMGLPWFTTALDPRVGAAKLITLPGVRNAVGAATGVGISQVPKLNQAVAVKRVLTTEKAKEYLRKAKNNREKAREMAMRDGWEIPA